MRRARKRGKTIGKRQVKCVRKVLEGDMIMQKLATEDATGEIVGYGS